MIHINSNDPEHMKARQNVKPLTMGEEHELILTLNYFLFTKATEGNSEEDDLNYLSERGKEILQRFLYRYENLKHLEAIGTGFLKNCNHDWEGVTLVPRST